MIIDVTDRLVKPIDEIEDDELESTVEGFKDSIRSAANSIGSGSVHDFSDSLIDDYITESPTSVSSVPTSAPDSDEWFDFFDTNPVAAMYTARAIVYDFVDSPQKAKALYDKIERNYDWDIDELLALESLLADALVSANYHDEAMSYVHNRSLPVNISFQIDAASKRKIENLLMTASPVQKISLLGMAINTLVLNDYI